MSSPYPQLPAPGYTSSNSRLVSDIKTVLENLQETVQGSAFYGDFLADCVLDGFTTYTSSGLSATLSSGTDGYSVMVCQGVRLPFASGDSRLTNTYTASKDTYVDVSPLNSGVGTACGTLTFTAVANGATAPALATGYTRLCKVVSGASSIASVTYLTTPYQAPRTIFNQFRCYLVSGSPYADGSSSGNSTIYLGGLPDVGNLGSYYSGSSLITVPITQIPYSVVGTAATMYDLYVNLLTGSFTTTAWSSTSTAPTRGSDTAGRFTQNGNTSNLWVCSFYCKAANTVFDYTGSRHLWNVFNQIEKACQANNNASAYFGTGSTALTTVGGNTTDGAGRFSFIQGYQKQIVKAAFSYSTLDVGAQNNIGAVGIGFNSTTVAATGAICSGGQAYSNSAQANGPTPVLATLPLVGYNYVQQLFLSSSASGINLYSPVINGSVWV